MSPFSLGEKNKEDERKQSSAVGPVEGPQQAVLPHTSDLCFRRDNETMKWTNVGPDGEPGALHAINSLWAFNVDRPG